MLNVPPGSSFAKSAPNGDQEPPRGDQDIKSAVTFHPNASVTVDRTADGTRWLVLRNATESASNENNSPTTYWDEEKPYDWLVFANDRSGFLKEVKKWKSADERTNVGRFRRAVEALPTLPCFALMVAVSVEDGAAVSLGVAGDDLDGVSISSEDPAIASSGERPENGASVLSWVSRDSSKPGRRPLDKQAPILHTFVAHSSLAFARDIINAIPENKEAQQVAAKAAMLLALKDLIFVRTNADPDGGDHRPLQDTDIVHVGAHRWGAAFPGRAVGSWDG